MHTRAVVTWNNMADVLDLHKIPVHKTWRLNERHYGVHQGHTLPYIKENWPEKYFTELKTNYDFAPDHQDKNSEEYKEMANDPAFKDLPREILSTSESMRDVVNRTVPYYHDTIAP